MDTGNVSNVRLAERHRGSESLDGVTKRGRQWAPAVTHAIAMLHPLYRFVSGDKDVVARLLSNRFAASLKATSAAQEVA